MIKDIYYSLLNLVTLGKGMKRSFAGNKIQMPVRYYKYFRDEYEADNLSIINKQVQPGMNIIDVGAHIGLMSVILAKKVGEKGAVFSFEPTPSTFKLLQKTISLNKAGNIITPENAALAEESGETTFYVSDYHADNSNSLVDNHRQDRGEHGIRVRLYSIDDYVSEKNIQQIDFIKIDAEGAELGVLKGARKTLQQFHPGIILALHPLAIRNFGHSLEEIWDFIENNQYRVEYKYKEMGKEEFVSSTQLFDVFLVSK